MVISGVQGACASQFITQLACNTHNHTTPGAACAQRSAILSRYMLTHVCKAMQPGLHSGYNDTCMQGNAARLTFRTLRVVPISTPLYTPVDQSTFGSKMRLKQPETQQRSENAPIPRAQNEAHQTLASAVFLACSGRKRHQGNCSIPNSVSAQKWSHLFIHSFSQVPFSLM